MRNSDPGEFAANHGVHARGLDLRPVLPQSTDQILGIDLTHTIHTDDVAAARGGPGGGGGSGGGGGGTTTFATYTSGAAGAYNITIEFKGTGWNSDYYNIFVTAANRLSNIIVGDVEDAKVISGKGGPKLVDDILITAELGAIDGEYGILGQAGPTSVRTVGSLPATATMQFDIADVQLFGLSVFSQVVLHEMAHSLGFGSIWDRLGLVTGGVFTGANAVQQYHNLGGTAAGIAVEQDGGSGTAGSHWDDDTFHNELMTGYIDGGANPFSAMSAASFADLGYVLSSHYSDYVDAYQVV